PYLFITIACGAISGFHSLISSGTTSKMIENESQALFIGYGAMLTESFVSVMALIAAGVLMPGDYFAINTTLTFDQLAQIGFPVFRINELSAGIGMNLLGRPGGAVSLAVGMAYIFSSIPFVNHLMAYFYQFALVFEALFILTTIDAGTRVSRYIIQELVGHIYRPFGNLGSLPANLISSLIVVFCWGYFILTGSVSSIWPMFGTANQMLSVLALSIGTICIVKSGKIRYSAVTAVPMFFMAVITFWSSFLLLESFYTKFAMGGKDAYVSAVNLLIVGGLLLLTSVIVVDSAISFYKKVSGL
ncbi:MAG: carbon starvation protein A, partial [Oligoflexales bacterium]|nr:carbon starvation protein A [Oligoflexales bacterium]